MDFSNITNNVKELTKLDFKILKNNTKNIVGSWKYALLAGFLALVLCSIPFDETLSSVLPKYQTYWAPPLYKFVFITFLFYFIGNSEWFIDL